MLTEDRGSQASIRGSSGDRLPPKLGSREGLSNNPSLSSFAGKVLIVDPAIGPFEASAQRGVRLPMQILPDEGVVAVAAIDALRRAEIVVALQFDACKFLGEINELVDRDGLARTQIDGLHDFRVHHEVDALQAVIDIHETAGLDPAASITFRQIAAGAFSRPPYHVPQGP